MLKHINSAKINTHWSQVSLISKSYSSPNIVSPKKEVVVITETSEDIGRSAGLRFAQGGPKDVINYLTDTTSANEVVMQIGTGRALAVEADASSFDSCAKLVDAA